MVVEVGIVITTKNSKGSEILPCLRTSMLVSLVNGCWVRDREPYNSIACISITPVPWALIPNYERWRKPGDTCTHSALHYRRGILSLGNFSLLEWQVNMPTFDFEGRYPVVLNSVIKDNNKRRSIFSRLEQNGPFLWRQTLFLSSKAIHEKILWTKVDSISAPKVCRNIRDPW